MTNLTQRVLEWIEAPGLASASSIASDSQTATARGLFLGHDTSDPAATGSVIFTDSQNLPTAVATILNRCQERADFHPASAHPVELARHFQQYAAEIDSCLFFTLAESSVVKQYFNKDYNLLFEQIMELYDGFGWEDRKLIHQSLINSAKSMFCRHGEDGSRNLFSQSTVDLTDSEVSKIHLHYTSLRMIYSSGKAEVMQQEYQVSRATYIVLTPLISGSAAALTKLTRTSIDSWATSATTPEVKNPNLCFY